MNKHDRQTRVRELFKGGKSKTEIADELGVTRKTVQRDLQNVPQNVPHGENVPFDVPNVALTGEQNVALSRGGDRPKDTKDTIWRKRLGVWEEFRRYMKVGQKYLTVGNIEEMVRVNDVKIKAIKELSKV